ISKDAKLSIRLLFVALAWGALIAFSREFIISQAAKKDDLPGILGPKLVGIHFHQGEPLCIFLYLLIFLFSVLALVAALMDNYWLAAIYVVGLTFCLVFDYILLRQIYALLCGILAIL